MATLKIMVLKLTALKNGDIQMFLTKEFKNTGFFMQYHYNIII